MLELPCEVEGCDRTDVTFVSLVPEKPSPTLQLFLDAKDFKAAAQFGLTVGVYCDFHAGLIREDRIEIIDQKTGERLFIYDEPS